MLRGTTRERPRNPEPVTLSAKIHNRFDIEVIDSRTGKIRQQAMAENVICNGLWNRLLTNGGYFTHIHYGTGTGTPAATDAHLFTFLGSAEGIQDSTGLNRAARYAYLRKRIQLNEQTAVGSTLTEVGVGYSSSASSLCTHALLQDMNGNTISIQKTSTDIVNIYATVYVHWGDSFRTGHIQMSYDFNWFLLYLVGQPSSYGTSYYAPNRARLASRKQNGATNMTNGSSTVDVANRKITITYERFPIAQGNVEFGAAVVNLLSYAGTMNSNYYKTVFFMEPNESWFPGTTITGEAIGTGDGTTVDFSTKFELPDNATIFVDGVEATNVTVDKVPLAYNDMGRYFQSIVVDNGVVYPYSTGGWPTDDRTIGMYDPGIYTYYNPFYEHGIASYTRGRVTAASHLLVSDDGINWTGIGNVSTTPANLVHSKYWRVDGRPTHSVDVTNMIATDLTGKNIHFTTPPAAGSVITANYTTSRIAKDTDHVFDLTVEIQLGEYTE